MTVSLSILRLRVQDALQIFGRTMAEFCTSTRFCTLASFWASSAAAIFEAFIEKAFFGDWSQHPLVVDADDKLSFVQRLKKTRARHPTCCRYLNAF